MGKSVFSHWLVVGGPGMDRMKQLVQKQASGSSPEAKGRAVSLWGWR